MLRDVAISEAARSDLYNGLRDVLGPQNTEPLMSVVKFYDLDEVATKRDLAELKGEIARLRVDITTDMAKLRVDMTTEIGALRKTMSQWMLTVLVAVIGAMAAIGLVGKSTSPEPFSRME